MATVVELEEIVEEVVRANTREAVPKKEDVSFTLLGTIAEQRNRSLGARLAVHPDETRTLHQKQRPRTDRCAALTHSTDSPSAEVGMCEMRADVISMWDSE